MGENKYTKELDVFAKKYVREIPQEQPSMDFTSNLMQKIVLETKSSVFTSKSLISKKGWFGIAVLVITSLFLTFNTSEKSSFTIPEINISFLDKLQFYSLLEVLSVSNTTVYAFVFFGLMIIIQFTYLKKYFDNKFS